MNTKTDTPNAFIQAQCELACAQVEIELGDIPAAQDALVRALAWIDKPTADCDITPLDDRLFWKDYDRLFEQCAGRVSVKN